MARHTVSAVRTYSEADILSSLKTFYGLKLDDEQKEFRNALWNEDVRIVFCNSKAGTGKTTISVGVAYLLYLTGRYNGIVYICSPTVEEKQGYLPGGLEEKSAPYMEPLYEALITIGLNPMQVMASMDDEISSKTGAFIKALPHTYLRGCNFEKKVVIMDECSNFYRSDIKKTVTRMHDSCKVICIGHTEQCDIYKNPHNSGFKALLELFQSKNDPRVAICELKTNHRGWISSVADELESEIKI